MFYVTILFKEKLYLRLNTVYIFILNFHISSFFPKILYRLLKLYGYFVSYSTTYNY